LGARLQVINGQPGRENDEMTCLGNLQGCLGCMRGTVQNKKIMMLRDLERLLYAAILLDGDVRL
jgi:hypothetical protein